MKWFKPKYSVCAECGVHFEPVAEAHSQWGHLCKIHRIPAIEKDMRKKAVIYWASVNWERLAKMMDDEYAEQQADFNRAMLTGLGSICYPVMREK